MNAKMLRIDVVGVTCFILVAVHVRVSHGQTDASNNSIPFTTECRLTLASREYVGTLNVTEGDLSCQPWADTTPHYHSFTSATATEFPGDGNAEQAGNKCRNPDMTWDQGLWCYTMDPSVRWQSCNVPMCECKLNWDVVGERYLGVTATTHTGKQCQAWTSSTPHQHPFNVRSFFRDHSVSAASNYCRNPNTTRPDGPWCYTTDPTVEWEYCVIPVCDLRKPDSTTTVTTQPTTTSMTSSTRRTPSTGRTTRTTTRRRTTTTSTSPQLTPTPASQTGNEGAMSSSTLATSVAVPLVLIFALAIIVVIFYIRCYRGDGRLPGVDVIRKVLPWRQTSVHERFDEKEAESDANNKSGTQPKTTPTAGIENPIYDVPSSITQGNSLKHQPGGTDSSGPLSVNVDTEHGYVTMSQIQLT